LRCAGATGNVVDGAISSADNADASAVAVRVTTDADGMGFKRVLGGG
jgi:hypothetical protein